MSLSRGASARLPPASLGIIPAPHGVIPASRTSPRIPRDHPCVPQDRSCTSERSPRPTGRPLPASRAQGPGEQPPDRLPNKGRQPLPGRRQERSRGCSRLGMWGRAFPLSPGKRLWAGVPAAAPRPGWGRFFSQPAVAVRRAGIRLLPALSMIQPLSSPCCCCAPAPPGAGDAWLCRSQGHSGFRGPGTRPCPAPCPAGLCQPQFPAWRSPGWIRAGGMSRAGTGRWAVSCAGDRG